MEVGLEDLLAHRPERDRDSQPGGDGRCQATWVEGRAQEEEGRRDERPQRDGVGHRQEASVRPERAFQHGQDPQDR